MFATRFLLIAVPAWLYLLPAFSQPAKQPLDVRVMSYNIRYGMAEDGENHWDKRKEFLVETIQAFNPDLLGTQETLGFQRDYLAEKLPGYAVLGVGRDDGGATGEMTALYFKRDRFEKLDGGHFWLSETPDRPGSKSWDTSLTRMATWVKLRDRRQPKAKPLVFFNTHFDHRGQQARLESARLLRCRATALGAECRVIVTGDFNAGEDSPPYRAFFGVEDILASSLRDAYRITHPVRAADEGSFSNFKAGAVSGPRIDWIGVSREWRVLAATIDRTERAGRTPSDHFAVTAVLRPVNESTQISFTQKHNQIEVEIGGQPFTTFHYGTDWPKPFLHPLRTATGVVVTRGFPLEKHAGESSDHHWHRGLWFAHGDINGVDFWRETSGNEAQDKKLPLPVGRIVAKAAPRSAPGARQGTIVAEFDLIAPDGKSLGTLRERLTFQRLGAHNIVDVQATIVADRGRPLKMGDTEEGLLGFRFADAFKQERGATLMNSEGLKGTENIWGKRARWVDYSTTISSQPAGVAIFDHPANPKHPTFWHARGYGLNAANPFGEHDFYNDKSRDGSRTIPANGSMTFRYRVLIHHGDAASANVEQLYATFARTR